MRAKLKTIHRLSLAVGVVIALAFGVAEAWAGPECTEGLPATCWPDCDYLCGEYGYPYGGQCLPQYCCQCFEK